MQSSGSEEAGAVDRPGGSGGRGRGAPQRHVAVQARQSRSETTRIIAIFFAEGLTLQQASAMSYTVLLPKLNEERLLDVMAQTVEHIFLLSYRRARPGYTVAMNLKIKVFMAAYIIRYAPQNAFEELNGELEQKLAELVVPLLDSFQQICDLLRDTPASAINRTLMVSFQANYTRFIFCFRRWKLRNDKKISMRVRHALKSIFVAQKELQNEGPEAEKTLLQFKCDRERLRHRLLLIEGEEALRAFEEEAGETAQPLPTQESVNALMRDTGTVSPATGDSPSSAKAGRMTNEQMAHELLLDPHFKMDNKGGAASENPAFAAARDAFRDAYWLGLRQDLQLDPPCYVRVATTADELHTALLAMHTENNASLDIRELAALPSVKTMIQQRQFDWEKLVHFVQTMRETIRRMQSPRRDLESRTEWAEVQTSLTRATETLAERAEAFCTALRTITKQFTHLRIDVSNSRLRMIEPVIRLHGVEYVRVLTEKRLAEATARGDTSALDATREWMAGSVRDHVAEHVVSLQSLRGGDALAFERVHAGAVLSLVMEPNKIPIPTLLLLDTIRLQGFQAEFAFNVFASTVLLLLSQNPGLRDLTAQNQGVLAKFFATHSPRKVDTAVIVQETISFLRQQDPALPEAKLAAVHQILRQSKDGSHEVRAIVRKRMAQLWTLAATTKEPANVTPLPTVNAVLSAVTLPPILAGLLPRVTDAGRRLRRVTGLNLRVHAARYNQMISEAVQGM